MRLQRFRPLVLFLLTLCLPTLLFAQSSRPEFKLNVFSEVDLVSNPDRVENPEEDELQTRVGADIFGSYEGAAGYFDLAYELTEHRFRNNSQADQSTWEGASTFFYSPVRSFDFKLQHSIDQVQENSADLALIENTIQRSNSLAEARLLANLEAGTQLITALAFGRNQYEESSDFSNDSERVILDLSFNRQVRRHFDYYFGLTGADVEFVDQEGFNYQQQTGYVGFNIDYEKIIYHVEVGYTVLEFDEAQTEEQSNSVFDVSLQYLLDSSELTVGTTLLVRDSSQASASGGSNQGSQEEADIIEEHSTYIEYEIDNICQFCSVTLQARRDDRDYKRVIENSEVSQVGGVNISYQIKRPLRFFINLTYEDLKYPNAVDNDYVSRQTDLGLVYTYTSALVLGVNYSLEAREGGRTADYDNEIIGVNFNYQF